MKKILFALLASSLIVGCAKSNSLARKVAFELGEEPENVQVTNVRNGMYETTFNANIRGVMHNCTALGGNIWSFGQALNPNCVPVGGGKKKGSCNAMLKAAGKCK